MNLEAFISTITDFDKKSDYDKIRLIAYHLTTLNDEPLSSFVFSNINNAFDEISLKKPKHFIQLFRNLTNKGDFIPTNAGPLGKQVREYKLNRSLKNSLELELMNKHQIGSSKTHFFERVYDSKNTWNFHTDLRLIISEKKPSNVFIIDQYCDNETLELYFSTLENAKINLLVTQQMATRDFSLVIKKFKDNKNTSLETRIGDIHDRVLVLDDDVWVIGQSITHAGKKPTYLVKLRETALELKQIYEKIWQVSKKVN